MLTLNISPSLNQRDVVRALVSSSMIRITKSIAVQNTAIKITDLIRHLLTLEIFNNLKAAIILIIVKFINKSIISSYYRGDPVPLITVPEVELPLKKVAIANANTEIIMPIIKIL